jgi:hypothetical protein
LRLLCFFITFLFFRSTLAPHLKQFALYTTNDGRRVTISFSPACPSLAYHD